MSLWEVPAPCWEQQTLVMRGKGLPGTYVPRYLAPDVDVLGLPLGPGPCQGPEGLE
jgi:hypothetical protein